MPLSGDPRSTAARYAGIAGLVTGGRSHYTADVGSGTVVAFLVDHPAVGLPPPDAAAATRVLTAGVAAGAPGVDLRRAVASYGELRGFAVTEEAERTRLAGPGGEVVVTFDAHGRVTAIGGGLSAGGR